LESWFRGLFRSKKNWTPASSSSPPSAQTDKVADSDSLSSDWVTIAAEEGGEDAGLEFSIQQDVDKDLITLWKRKASLAIGHLLYFDGDLSVSVSLLRNGESIKSSTVLL
jgi:hypothetical protein